jgi:hypothetical protein
LVPGVLELLDTGLAALEDLVVFGELADHVSELVGSILGFFVGRLFYDVSLQALELRGQILFTILQGERLGRDFLEVRGHDVGSVYPIFSPDFGRQLGADNHVGDVEIVLSPLALRI